MCRGGYSTPAPGAEGQRPSSAVEPGTAAAAAGWDPLCADAAVADDGTAVVAGGTAGWGPRSAAGERTAAAADGIAAVAGKRTDPLL